MQKITPFLWFNNNGEEAIKFYTSIFPNSRMKETMAGPDGGFLTGTFELFPELRANRKELGHFLFAGNSPSTHFLRPARAPVQLPGGSRKAPCLPAWGYKASRKRLTKQTLLGCAEL